MSGSGLTHGSYCTVDDVCSAFPHFARATPGSVQDEEIQGWVDDRKTRIRSILMTRGYDPDLKTLTQDQKNFLKSLNRDGAIGDLGDALVATITLQPGEYSLSSAHRKTYEAVLKEISEGLHDRFFQDGSAKTSDVGPLFYGIAGAETSPDETPTTRHENRFFGMNQVF